MFHVRRADQIVLATPAAYAPHSSGHRRAEVVGQSVGSLHTGITQCALRPGGAVGEHLHSFEKSFYVLEGRPQLTVDGRTWQLDPDDCGLVPLGAPHAWRVAADGGPARWIEASAPAPRPAGHPSPDTFFTGAPAPEGEAERLDIRDPRTRTFFRLEPGQMELDNLRIGAPVDAPTVSASMATALLAYSGIALKMLVDPRLGAVLHQMFMVEYEPGGAAQLHDHPLEEATPRLRRGRGGGRRRALHAPRRRRLLDRRRLRPRLLEHERARGSASSRRSPRSPRPTTPTASTATGTTWPSASAALRNLGRMTREGLRRPADTEQRATSLELFYDLVFVFAVTQVSHLLLDAPDLAGRGAGGAAAARRVVVVELHDLGHERARPGVARRPAAPARDHAREPADGGRDPGGLRRRARCCSPAPTSRSRSAATRS